MVTVFRKDVNVQLVYMIRICRNIYHGKYSIVIPQILNYKVGYTDDSILKISKFYLYTSIYIILHYRSVEKSKIEVTKRISKLAVSR